MRRSDPALVGQSCCICMTSYGEEGEGDTVVRLGECAGHFLHKGCAVASLRHSQKCPSCARVYGVSVGLQPPGTMDVARSGTRLAGHSCGTLQVQYSFPDGVQTGRDPSPGSRYSGTSRVGYLPDDLHGRKVLRLLVRCFQRRHTFVIGTSVTTGVSNCVIWNGIHHKTSTHGGPTSFGYPDATYLSRVTEELAAKGVLADNLMQDSPSSPDAVVHDHTGLCADLLHKPRK